MATYDLMIDINFVTEFKTYCDAYGWAFDNYSSEFTFQFRLGWFINEKYKDRFIVDFETNIRKLDIPRKFKSEIDIYAKDRLTQADHAIEVKFIKDPMGYDISLFNLCVDIKFLEQLKMNNNFKSTTSLAFSTIEKAYTPPANGKYKATDKRLHFYKCFREDKCISGTIFRSEKEIVEFDAEYRLEWFDFTPRIKACIIHV